MRAFATVLFLGLMAPIRVKGWRKVPRDGPLLIIANHQSNTDPVVVQYACRRHIRFLARRDLFTTGAMGKFMRWFGAVPIKQGAPDKTALRTAIELIESGEAVGIFPEGRLSPDGRLLPMLPGVALIVRQTGVRCICLGINGSRKVMPFPEVKPRLAFSWIVATWGEPREFERGAGKSEILGWIESELFRLSGQESA
ncbi:MAG: 1-acyl-sn-glycerol-3-phosphate acyltransferase [Fimbriimonadaceae bacterium]|nr:1-acyl-sn-glycerol-3-phosphate acyltransferase [Fimbriimonadaceae bacterium]QYK58104.1 MAG: 1-acyl-sn-glycerol-3-phosphate acyltransferase [Fimbriimonadaceae bacterium]